MNAASREGKRRPRHPVRIDHVGEHSYVEKERDWPQRRENEDAFLAAIERLPRCPSSNTVVAGYHQHCADDRKNNRDYQGSHASD